MSNPNSTTEPIRIPLTQGQTALVSAEDADLADINWYAQRHTNRGVYYSVTNERKPIGYRRRRIYMHREILARMLERPLSEKEDVDHIDMNTLNNQRENLRLATRSENLANRHKQKNNTSGYKGVCWNKIQARWQAKIGVNQKKIFLGYFDTPEEAHAAYCEASKKYHGEFGRIE